MNNWRAWFSCLVKERLAAELALSPRIARHLNKNWRDVHNRIDDLRHGEDGRSRYIVARDSSWLTVAKQFPKFGGRLFRAASTEYPFRLSATGEVASSQYSANAEPIFSVIIPFAGTDRVRQLQTVLEGFTSQTVSHEVILVQGDDSAAKLRIGSHVLQLNTSEPSGTKFNKSRLFNAGVRVARGKYLLLHDADILVPQVYLQECLTVFHSGFTGLSPIRFLFYLNQRQTQQLQEQPDAFGIHEVTEILQNFAGGSIAVTKETYDRIGGFDESFEGWGGEDVEFHARVRRSRFFEGRLTPALHLWHPPALGKSQEHPNLRQASQLIAQTLGAQ